MDSSAFKIIFSVQFSCLPLKTLFNSIVFNGSRRQDLLLIIHPCVDVYIMKTFHFKIAAGAGLTAMRQKP